MPSGLFDSLGSGFGPVVTYAFAAIVVFVLLLVVLAVAKRSLRPGLANSSLRKGPRLAIIDVAAVDQRRKLVLLRRDEVEHLVLIGGQNDLVVEGGIVRTPSAAPAFPAERPALSRFDHGPTVGGSASDGRPAVVTPDPRLRSGDDEMSRPASPLRRPLPQPTAPRHKVPPVEPRPEPAEPVFEKSAEIPPPVAAPAPLIEPAIVAEVPEHAPPQPSPPIARPVLAVPPEAERRAPQPEQRPAPPEEIPAIFIPERTSRTEANPPPVSRERPDIAAPVKSSPIPAFLQRSDEPPESREEEARPSPAPSVSPPPRVVSPPSPPVSVAPPAPRMPVFERANLRPEAPASAVPQRSERPPVGEPPAPPRVPAVFAAPPVKVDEPVAPVRPPVIDPPIPARTEEAPEEPQPPAEAEAPSVETTDDADRRPLSVRSFASAIQSRRSAQDLTAQPRPAPSVERPQDRFRTTATPTYPIREPAPPTPAPSARSPATEDSSLDDALSRELDSDLGLLDWADETRATSEKTAPAKPQPAAEPKPQPSAEPKQERRPTLEEEMERLLSDFDFGSSPRR